MDDGAVGPEMPDQPDQPEQPDQQDESARSADLRGFRRRGMANDRPPWLGLAFGAAILVAPFLALLYGIEAGLLVMILALAAVGMLAVLSARAAEPDLRQRLLLVAGVNGVLALICLIVLLTRS